MWQRIQTLWLLLVGVLMSVFAFLDLAVFTLPTGQYYLLDNWSIHSIVDGSTVMPAWATGALSILVAVSAL